MSFLIFIPKVLNYSLDCSTKNKEDQIMTELGKTTKPYNTFILNNQHYKKHNTRFWIIVFIAVACGAIIGAGILPAIFTGKQVKEIPQEFDKCESWSSEIFSAAEGETFEGTVAGQEKILIVEKVNSDKSINVFVMDESGEDRGIINSGKVLVLKDLAIRNFETREKKALLMVSFDISYSADELCDRLEDWNQEEDFECSYAYLNADNSNSENFDSTSTISCQEIVNSKAIEKKLTAICCK